MIATATVAEAIRAANERFAKRFATRDGLGLGELYTADAVLLPPGSDLVKGRGNIEAFWAGAINTAMKEVSELALDTIDLLPSEEFVVEVGRYRLRTAGRESAGDGKYLVVWKEEQGNWKICRDIWNANA